MNTNNILFLTIVCTVLFTSPVFSQYIAPDGHILLGNQFLDCDDISALMFSDDYGENSQMIFMRDDAIVYGAVKGFGEEKFGMTDAQGDWFLEHDNQTYTKFYVGNDEKMIIQQNGNIGIGTDSPMYKLDICGTVRAAEVLVEDDWCDYVFKENYQLPTLEEEKEHIQTNGYLLGFESEKAMDGKISLHDVTKRQQVKIEEYALQLIQLNETNKVLMQQYTNIATKYDQLEAKIIQIQNNVPTKTKH